MLAWWLPLLKHARHSSPLDKCHPCSGDTEAEEEHPPRRLLAGRSQGNLRRLFGVQPASSRPDQGTAAVPRRTAGRPQRANSQASVIRQDLLAPVIPGHESDEEANSEAGTEQGHSGRAEPAERLRAGLSQRRPGEGPRASPQRGAAALRDVREDFAEAEEVQQAGLTQGEGHVPFSHPCSNIPWLLQTVLPLPCGIGAAAFVAASQNTCHALHK